MQTYNIEITDTYAGEANYSWVDRITVQAKSMRGAITQASKKLGYHGFRLDAWCGNYASYKLQGACIIAFVTESYN
jgi:hypothetical protein